MWFSRLTKYDYLAMGMVFFASGAVTSVAALDMVGVITASLGAILCGVAWWLHVNG